MEGIEIRPITDPEVAAFYGQPLKDKVRAVGVWRGGELCCVAGVTEEGGWGVAFWDIKESVSAPKITFVRCADRIMRFIKESTVPVLAIPHTRHPNAGKLLRRLGFEKTGECDHGEVYQWVN